MNERLNERNRAVEGAGEARPVDRDRLLELGRQQHRSRDFKAAAHSFRAALAAGQDAATWEALGRSLNNLRDLAGAEEAFRRAVALDGGCASALDSLGHVQRARGDLAAAARSFRAALAADPERVSAHHNLGTILFQTGRLDAAIAAFEAGLKRQPDDPRALTNLADALRLSERFDEAQARYRQAVELDPDCVDAWAALGSMLLNRRQPDAAETALTEALRRMPGHSIALSAMAALKELRGDYAGGRQLLEPLVRSGRATPELRVAYGRVLGRLGHLDEALQQVETVVQSAPDERRIPPIFYYTLGDLYDAADHYDRAWQAYRTANDRQPGQFDSDGFARTVDDLLRFFDGEQTSGLARSAVRRQTPLFIVGMPRSGTSLVEQILGGHPRVFAGGERGDMLALTHRIQADLGARRRYPRCLSGATRRDFDNMAARYFDGFGELASAVTHVTDKMPANFLTLGLIALICPNARVIHCRRQPLDTALSCYFQNFNSAGLAFSRDPEHIGAYYRQYARLMERWHRVLDLPVMDIDYEVLVTDVATWGRRLVEFAGLAWDPACLDFHRLERTVITASHAQVRRPVYTTSVDRHRNYAKYLGPLKAALGIG